MDSVQSGHWRAPARDTALSANATSVPETRPRLTVRVGTSRRFCGQGGENMTILKLDYQDGHLELPVREAAEGASGVSVDGLLDRAGYVTYDPGFVNTASCVSGVTYI